MQTIEVSLDWFEVEDHHLGMDRVLYLWACPSTGQILYVGKADYCTLRRRTYCPSKGGVCERIRASGFQGDRASLLAAEVDTSARLTVKLLADVEAALIRALRPPGNVQYPRSRDWLRITCAGAWPLPQRSVWMIPERVVDLMPSTLRSLVKG